MFSTKRFYFKVPDIKGRAVEVLVALVPFSPFIVIFHTQLSLSFFIRKYVQKVDYVELIQMSIKLDYFF